MSMSSIRMSVGSLDATIGEAPPPAALSKPFLLNTIRIAPPVQSVVSHDKTLRENAFAVEAWR